jgi:hypothetical protein
MKRNSLRMIYLSGCMSKHRHPRLGFIMTRDRRDKVPTDAMVAVDNACFANPQGYSDETYLAYLQKFTPERTLFATAPDVLGSHTATAARSIPMLRRIRAMGFKSAFVAQDGWNARTAPWDEFDALFIGGSTEFKFRAGRHAVEEANARGKWAHMGRVNSLDRMRAAIGIGCKSADGTFLKFGPNVNWPRLKRWLDHIVEQPELLV